jgi:hypothetical protein
LYPCELSLKDSELLDGESSISLRLLLLPSVDNLLLSLSCSLLGTYKQQSQQDIGKIFRAVPPPRISQQALTLHQTPTVHDALAQSSVVVAKA